MSTRALEKRGKLAIATRLHLQSTSQPPSTRELTKTVSSFLSLAQTVQADLALVAVDAHIKQGFNLVAAVQEICAQQPVQILPVQPWGKFVPPLNAIVSCSAWNRSEYLLLVSAEVQLSDVAMSKLWKQMDTEDTLVVGATLPGHHYQHHKSHLDGSPQIIPHEVTLTGRTTPWNTLALWNVPKLALTGFLLLSEGLHHPMDGEEEAASGVEEVCTIATLQQILPQGKAKAKLVQMSLFEEKDPGVQWEQDFEQDLARKEWHEKKMASKMIRAQRQLDLLGLNGTVVHC